MKTIGGNANVVKKAVAPAIRRGSFFLSNRMDCRRLVINDDILLDPDFFSGMIGAKITGKKTFFLMKNLWTV